MTISQVVLQNMDNDNRNWAYTENVEMVGIRRMMLDMSNWRDIKITLNLGNI